MSQRKIDDLYDRLTSRKLWLAVLSILFGWWNYVEGRLSAVEFQAVVFGAVTAYSVSEAATDFAANWHSTPNTSVRTTVNAGSDAPSPSVKVEPSKPKRVRPSRAKPKATPVVAVGGKG